ARSSSLSAGFVDKRVKNFVGTGQEVENLFELRDPASGAPGTRSGDAVEYLQSIGADLSDVNMFTMTALIDQVGLANAITQFQANFTNGNLSQAFIDQVLQAYNATANGADPLFDFQVQKPTNNQEGHIYGFEVAGEYFLGNTGCGIAGPSPTAGGDIGYDITADPTADQFALLGLSDTANVTLIYENYGFSARLAWNWRGTFLSNNSRGGSRNPVFVDEYDQLDLNVSYDVTDNLSLSLEGINLTKSNVKTFARPPNQPWFSVEGDRRFYLGARYRF